MTTTVPTCPVPLCGEIAIGEMNGRPFCSAHQPPQRPCAKHPETDYRWSYWVGWVCEECSPPSGPLKLE